MTRINFNFVFFAFLFCSVFICSSSFGQKLEQGTFVINECFNFSSNKSEQNDNNNYYSTESKRTGFDATTSFGYLLKENQEIGISISLGQQKSFYKRNLQGNITNDDHIERSYGFGIYYKKYIDIVDKLSFFVSPQLSYLKSKSDMKDASQSINEFNSNLVRGHIYTGILYHPTQRFGLSLNLLGIGVNYYSRKETEAKQNSFSLSDFGTLNLGVQFML